MMDTYNEEHRCEHLRMSRLKSGALWLMMVLVLWTVVPSSACLLTARGTAHRACCQQKAPDCSRAMCSDGNCCRMERGQTAAEPGAVFSVERGHELEFVPATIQPLLKSDAASELSTVASAPAPDTSPGKSSILRI